MLAMTPPPSSSLSLENLLGGRPECIEFSIPHEWSYGIMVEAGWNDVDKLGHVNNVAYWRWCDDVRVQYAMDAGLTVPSPDQPSFVVVKAGAEFLGPMSYRERGVMTCRAVRLGRSSLDTEHALWLRNGKAFMARFTIVLVNPTTMKSVTVPASIRDRIAEIQSSTSQSPPISSRS
jgi:acyl-CoA thioester hydrolase